MTESGTLCWRVLLSTSSGCCHDASNSEAASLSSLDRFRENRHGHPAVNHCLGTTTLVTSCEFALIICVIPRLRLPFGMRFTTLAAFSWPYMDYSWWLKPRDFKSEGKLNIWEFLFLIFRSTSKPRGSTGISQDWQQDCKD
ncbi:uncharacterized protein V6R79_013358 [Siganus canaliculatus]